MRSTVAALFRRHERAGPHASYCLQQSYEFVTNATPSVNLHGNPVHQDCNTRPDHVDDRIRESTAFSSRAARGAEQPQLLRPDPGRIQPASWQLKAKFELLPVQRDEGSCSLRSSSRSRLHEGAELPRLEESASHFSATTKSNSHGGCCGARCSFQHPRTASGRTHCSFQHPTPAGSLALGVVTPPTWVSWGSASFAKAPLLGSVPQPLTTCHPHRSYVLCQLVGDWGGRWRPLSSLNTAAGNDSEATVEIFDRQLKTAQRDRAARLSPSSSSSSSSGGAGDPLLEEISSSLLDRLDDCRRDFPRLLLLGGAIREVSRALAKRAGVSHVSIIDSSARMLNETKEMLQRMEAESSSSPPMATFEFIEADEEHPLPIEPSSFDAVIACAGLHWVNDLPTALLQCRFALKPDGLFLGAMLGGDTLRELRVACTVAQMEREGGISPRVSPFAQCRDAGNLLTRVGLALPTVDIDDVTMHYPSVTDLVLHLRCMGETNAIRHRDPILKRDTALASAAIYEMQFRKRGGEESALPATFQVIYMTGWAPHESQTAPQKRGSASVSLKDLHKALQEKR